MATSQLANDINTKYLGITKDATMAVELSTAQFQVC